MSKKGDLQECKNGRGTMLLSSSGKVLSRLILKRLKNELDKDSEMNRLVSAKIRAAETTLQH